MGNFTPGLLMMQTFVKILFKVYGVKCIIKDLQRFLKKLNASGTFPN